MINVDDVVYGLAASPAFADDGICFAARQSGLYRSEDAGISWQSAYGKLLRDEPSEPLMTSVVALSPAFASDKTIFAAIKGSLLRSFDGGQSWTPVGLPPPAPFVSNLMASPSFAQDGVLLAATLMDGVFRSTDRGRQWQPSNFGLLDLNVTSLAFSPSFAHDETAYLGTETGLYRSTNGGRAWHELPFQTETGPLLSIALSPHYGEDGTLYIGTETAGLFCSVDRANNWSRIAIDFHPVSSVTAIVLATQFPASPDLLIMTADRLLISRDGGKTWNDWQDGLVFPATSMTLLAPCGIMAGAPLLVGLAEHGILRL